MDAKHVYILDRSKTHIYIHIIALTHTAKCVCVKRSLYIHVMCVRTYLQVRIVNVMEYRQGV